MGKQKDKIEMVKARLQAGDKGKDIARDLKVSEAYVSVIKNRAGSMDIPIDDLISEPNSKKVQAVFGEQNGSLDIRVSHEKGNPPRWLDIKNPDKLLKECEIDTSIWMVHSVRVSSSEVTMKLRVRSGKDYEDTPATYTNVHVSVQLKRRSVSE